MNLKGLINNINAYFFKFLFLKVYYKELIEGNI